MNQPLDPAKYVENFCERRFAASFRILLFLGLAYALPIMLVDRFYLDDLGRSLYGYTDWSAGGRPLADMLFALVSFGTPVADISPLPQLLAVVLLAAGAATLASMLFDRLPGLSECIVVFPIIGSPFFLENLAYKFDALTMSAAVLIAVLATLPLRNKAANLVVGSLLIVSAHSLYHPAVNLFIAITVVLWIAKSRADAQNHSNFAYYLLGNTAKFVIGSLIYMSIVAPATINSEYGLNNSATIPISLEGVAIFQHNLVAAFGLIDEYVASIPVWLSLVLLIATIGFILGRLRWSVTAPGVPIGASRLGLLTCALVVLVLSPFGILLVLKQPVLFPRTFVGFAGLMVFVLYALHAVLNRAPKLRLALLVPLAFMYLCAFTFASAMRAQERFDQVFIGNLLQDLRASGFNNQSVLILDGRQPRAPLVKSAMAKWVPADRLVPAYLYYQWIWGYVLLRHYGLEFQDPSHEVVEKLAETCEWPLRMSNSQYRIRQRDNTFTVSMTGARCS